MHRPPIPRLKKNDTSGQGCKSRDSKKDTSAPGANPETQNIDASAQGANPETQNIDASAPGADPETRNIDASAQSANREAQDIDAKTQAANRKLYGIDWNAIEHAYVHGDWSVQRIADAYGPSDTTIHKRAKAEGWVRLVGTKPLGRGRPPREPGMRRPKPAPLAVRRRRRVVKRLLKLLDNRLAALERRMSDTDANLNEQSATEIEREARALSTVAGSFAKIVELEEAARKSSKGSDAGAVRTGEDADRIRRELAQRLARITPTSGV